MEKQLYLYTILYQDFLHEQEAFTEAFNMISYYMLFILALVVDSDLGQFLYIRNVLHRNQSCQNLLLETKCYNIEAKLVSVSAMNSVGGTWTLTFQPTHSAMCIGTANA